MKLGNCSEEYTIDLFLCICYSFDQRKMMNSILVVLVVVTLAVLVLNGNRRLAWAAIKPE
jgi:hypothetical protein